MSFMALNSALSGLRVAQQQLNTISTNVSNATTPGYTRKILPQSAQVLNSLGQTIGVQSGTIIRNVDLNLERELWTQVSAVSALDIKATYLDTIEKFHGATNKEASIAAKIADLKDKFAALSDSPADGFLLQSTLNQAIDVANQFNQYGKLVTQMRNDTQSDIGSSVQRVNALLTTISSMNADVKSAANLSRSTAAIEDQRDIAIKELATYLDISYFMRGDGVMVVQTKTGVQLADERPTEVFFDPDIIGASTTYPQNVSGIFVGGDPSRNPGSFDVAGTKLGGKIGGLLELRDDILVRYQSQMDELAHKLALRMDAQGLRLFTDPAGQVPADTPPDPSTNPPTPVTYVGFASIIQVNSDIVNNVSLIQQGTYTSDRTIPSASNEVLRRIIQFSFGDINYQQAAGTTNLNFGAPATDLQSWLGLPSSNNVVGGINLSAFSQISDGVSGTSDLMEDLNQFFVNPANDRFRVTFSEPRLGIPDMTIEVDLSDAQAAFPINGTTINNALDQITSQINAQIAAAVTATPALAGHTAVATRNSNGQLSLRSASNVQLTASGFANSMGSQAFGALGLREDSYPTEDPYFDVSVGNDSAVRITIAPGDDINDLIAKLEYNPATGTGVPGLHVSYDVATGRLTLRPGVDDSNGGHPHFGGDIRIVSGPGRTAGSVNPALAALPQGVSVVGALFGKYNVSGGTVTESSPISNVNYASETTAGSGIYTPVRRTNLGPNANIKTDILTGSNIIDFAQKLINAQAQDIVLNTSRTADETTLRNLLEERFTNETGVNIDEEMSHLIVIQTAYAAAARAVTAADEMFKELLNSI